MNVTVPARASEWIYDDARRALGVLGSSADVFNVYSAGDSGIGREVIEFTMRAAGAVVPWTAEVITGPSCRHVICRVGWNT